MGETAEECYCKDCNEPRSNDDAKCKKCGSDGKKIVVTISETLRINEMIKGKQREAESRKPVVEFLAGDSLSKKDGVWYDREYTIDRKHDAYREVIRDKASGKVIHKCEEPLSKHIGHGSAKSRELEREPENRK